MTTAGTAPAQHPEPQLDAPGPDYLQHNPVAGEPDRALSTQREQFFDFLAEAQDLRRKAAKAAKKRSKQRPGTQPRRPDDWADPDPGALAALPRSQNPVDRALDRAKPGRTRDTFRSTLRICCELLAGAPIGSMNPEEVRAYPWHQIDPGKAIEYRYLVYERYRPQSSRNDKISAVRRVLLQCYRSGLISSLRLERLLEELYTLAPGPSSKGRQLTAEEILDLMRACATTGSTRAKARNTAIVALMATSGIRVGELVRIQLSDWDRGAQTILLRDTKNGRDHLVHLHPGALVFLEPWLKARGHRPGALFTSLNTTAPAGIAESDVRWMINDRADRAGVARFGPHDFRRTFASELLNTHDAVLVSHLLNHKKIQSTMIYDRREDGLKRAAVASLPLPSPAEILDTMTTDSLGPGQATTDAGSNVSVAGTPKSTRPSGEGNEGRSTEGRSAA